MIAALVGDECDCDQNEHDDEDHALFVRREFENPEQALHLELRSAEGISIIVSVMLSEANHLWLVLECRFKASNPRFFSRTGGIRMTRGLPFIFSRNGLDLLFRLRGSL